MERRKKVLLAITKGNWGGAQKYIYDLATKVPNSDYEIKVVIGNTGELNERLIKAGINVLKIDSLNRDINPDQDWQAIKHLYKIIKSERPDILHLNSSKMGLIGVIIGRLLKIPRIIFTVHGWAFNENRGWWQKKFLKLLQKLTVILTHQTIAVSEQTKNQIGGLIKYNNKITVIRNGIETIEFYDKNTSQEQLLEKVGQELNSNLLIGCIAELHKSKGLSYLIEAIKLLKQEGLSNFSTFIIGEGEERKNLQEKINRFNLNNEIFLVGKIDQASKLLKAFDIFILPSITEALPYVLLEAGQAGLPIISTNVGGISEIIDDQENGLIIRPASAKDLVGAIKYLINNPEKSLTFGRKVTEKINKEFSINNMVEKTIAIYK